MLCMTHTIQGGSAVLCVCAGHATEAGGRTEGQAQANAPDRRVQQTQPQEVVNIYCCNCPEEVLTNIIKCISKRIGRRSAPEAQQALPS